MSIKGNLVKWRISLKFGSAHKGFGNGRLIYLEEENKLRKYILKSLEKSMSSVLVNDLNHQGSLFFF